MSLLPGRRLGPYEIVGLVGRGGMGEVYRARDTRLNRTVALKVVNAEWSNRDEGRRRFEREAQTISRVNHPNVCALYDVGREDDQAFLVMEFVEGETLAARIARGPMPVRDVVNFGQAMARGLEAAHLQGVVHRDFKPANVILSKSGVKVLDFGLARALADERSLDQTGTVSFGSTGPGAVMGTLPYMAPEQVRGLEADARSDVFALGAVLYEMATGRRAFMASGQADLVSAILTEQPPPASSVQAGVPGLLERIIAQCLEKDADARPQGAGEVARALALITEGSSAPAPATRAATRWPERLAWMSGLAIALTLLGLQFRRAGAQVPSPAAPVLAFEVQLPEGSLFPEVVDVASTVAVSPDGQHVVFPLTTGDVSQLWLHTFKTVRTRPLRGTENASGPFWSPTSRHVAFFASGSLKRVAIDGDVVEQLCTTATVNRAGSWGVGDSIVFVDSAVNAVMRVAATGGTPEAVTSIDGKGIVWPHFLPDGRRFLLGSRGGLFLGDVARPTLAPVGDIRSAVAYDPSGQVIYVRHGALLAQPFDLAGGRIAGDARVVAEGVQYFVRTAGASFSVSGAGTIVYRPSIAAPRRIAWIGRDGRDLGDALPPAPWTGGLRLSPDGTRVAASQLVLNAGSTDVWVHDLRTNTPTRVTDDEVLDNWPAWWPDGRSVLVSRDGEDHPPRLARKPIADAMPPVWIMPTPPPGAARSMQYGAEAAPDGRAIAYGMNGDIWVWRVETSTEEPLVQTPFADGAPAFSPDGRWLAYDSNVSGRNEVYVRPFGRGGDSIRVSTAGGFAPRWRGDGREIFFLDPRGGIVGVGLAAGDAIQPGRPHVLAKGIGPIEAFDVSRDGERFVAMMPVSQTIRSTLHVILNWASSGT